jgi:hypothetical protein
MKRREECISSSTQPYIKFWNMFILVLYSTFLPLLRDAVKQLPHYHNHFTSHLVPVFFYMKENTLVCQKQHRSSTNARASSASLSGFIQAVRLRENEMMLNTSSKFNIGQTPHFLTFQSGTDSAPLGQVFV